MSELESLRAQVAAHKADWSRMHDAFQKVGWHPGRTDDLLSDILITRVADLRAQVSALEAETVRRNVSPSDRLHNICQAIAEQADESPFSREEWDRLDALTVAQGNRIKDLGAERDALRALLIRSIVLVTRYYSETPLGHQPHMIAHVAEKFLDDAERSAK